MSHLKLVTNDKPPQVTAPTVLAGQRYQLRSEDLAALVGVHGIVGDYRVDKLHSEAVPLRADQSSNDSAACYFWDTDVDLHKVHAEILLPSAATSQPLHECRLQSNSLLLEQANLVGPELLNGETGTELVMSAEFDLGFSTDSYAATLGVIHLVQSERFITLDDGEVIRLLDTSEDDEPVLYLESPDDEPVKPVGMLQPAGQTLPQRYTCQLVQQIPDSIGDRNVKTVTVLEQYHSYFMQTAVTEDQREGIWIPAHAPILWGWSIRIGRRSDGEWSIVRRKLILPTPSNDGMQLPVWQNNTVECAGREF